ncbi:iron ABC transporter permease [Fusibacter sp. Q10-2]|uniref:Iron ABC transporter permease n=2 Tax=Fusibacter ferrireducens TaxID=2785058 RepID=A0ABR9ZQ34_9FIRM|nr:iron ABC transporter permease [Fusibacter ferrireducens]
MYDGHSFDVMAPFRIILEGNLIKPIMNTLILGFCVVIGAGVVALPLAFITAKTEIGKHKWLDLVILVPFMTPPYIGSMAWILFLQPNGFFNQLLPKISGQEQLFFSFFGLVMIMSLHLFPFIYLIIKNALENISGNLDEAAVVHGASSTYKLIRITMPLLFSAFILGSLLVFVKAIGEFGTPVTFGRRIGFNVLTTEIHRYVSSWPISLSRATSLSYFLLFTCILIWCIQSIFSKKLSYQTVNGKGMARIKKSLSKPQKIISYFYIGLILTISVGIPYFSILATSLIKLRGYGLQKGNFTLEHYLTLFKTGSSSAEAFLTSLKIAILSASICVLIGILVALIVTNHSGKLSKLIDLLSLLPNSVPTIVLVIGLILFWNAKWHMIPIYNTFWMIVVTYVTFFIPYAVQYIKSALSQISKSLQSAGKICGGSSFYNFRKIMLPLMMPGIIAGWTMTFTIAFRELVGAIMILPPGMQTSSTYIFNQFEQGEASKGMAMAVVSVLITITILMLLNIFVDKRVNDGR